MDYDSLRFVRDPNPWVAPTVLPPPITTERLVVRRWQAGDGPNLFEAVDSDRQALLPWIISFALSDHRSIDESIYFVENQLRKVAAPACTGFSLGFFERDSGRCVGGAAYVVNHPEQREAEIGYWTRGGHHGRGYCTEAVRAMIDQGFQSSDSGGWGFRRISIECSSDNLGSKRVCEKLGLRLEVEAKQARYLGDEAGGRYHDILGYAVLASEWQAR